MRRAVQGEKNVGGGGGWVGGREANASVELRWRFGPSVFEKSVSGSAN